MRERPFTPTRAELAGLLAGTLREIRRTIDMDKLRVRLPNEVKSDLDKYIPGPHPRGGVGIHPAGMNDYGAVWIVTPDRGFLGVKPGEFHFVCPFVDGETILADFGFCRKVWMIFPRESTRLWIRESWCQTFAADDDSHNGYCYRATNNGPEPCRWRPAVTMPRAACRLFLEVERVRVEMVEGGTWVVDVRNVEG
jgi:hypothetical protein